MRKFKYIAFISSLVGMTINATTATDSNCLIESPRALLEEVSGRNPILKGKGYEVQGANYAVSQANAFANPEIDAEYSRLDTVDGKGDSFSAGLGLVLEVGGARSARRKAAQAQKTSKEAQFKLEQYTVLADALKFWYRYRQSLVALRLHESVLGTFQRFNRVLANRSLSPSQRIEKKTIEMAIADLRLKQAKVETSMQLEKNHLMLSLNNECQIEEHVFKGKFRLPRLSKAQVISNEAPEVRLTKSSIEVAQAQLDVERSKTIPNIVVGPTFEMENTVFGKNYTYGVALNTELPIFSWNLAGRNSAHANFQAEQIKRDAELRDLSVDLEAFRVNYEKLYELTKTLPSNEEILAGIKGVQRSFSRGIVSSSLLIESQRKYLEFFDSKSEFEEEAIMTLVEIYKLTGKEIFELTEGGDK